MHAALCFEYVHNGSLRDHISDECRGLDWHTRYKIIKGICEGLKYLREGLDFSVWHLDLKPENILLNDKMIPKIADFGLSRLLCEENTRKTINTFGTCGYWPPEYINHRVVSEFFDIFSLGVILVKIMIGPEGYTRIADMTTRKFVKHVQECWRKKLKEIAGPTSIEVYCNQVKRCIEIALECLKPNRQERPTIQYIVSSLNQTESMIGDQLLPIEQIDSGGESILHSTWSITSGTYSEEKDEASRPNYKEKMFQYPLDVTFNLLENITDGFSNEQLIGSGQYGEVYKGVHKDGQAIAVKLIHPTPPFDDKLFQKTLGYHAMAQHQNIIKLVGYCEVDQRRYIEHKGELVYVRMEEKVLCFDYMVNGSLEQKVLDECSGLDWHLRYGVIKGTCEGLRCLHEKLHKSIIHMDLKSRRILLGQNMIQRIIGGFALPRFDVVTGLLLDSHEYMPPEFIGLQVISKQHDIYSSGVIIMEMIIGTRRYPENDEMSPKKFIDHVHRRWTKRVLTTLSGTAVESYCQQVKKCVEIALKCVDNRQERPAIGDIVNMLNETETFEMLDIHPPELFFPLDPKKTTSCSLHLKNKGDDRVVFMLVSKNPMSYLAKIPLCGVVPPRCTYTISLTTRKQSRSKPPSQSVEFITLRSLAVGDHDLQRVGQGSFTDIYDDLFKEAKETAGDEVQEVTLKAVRDPPADGTTCETTQSVTIEIIATQNSQQVTSIDLHPMEPWIMTTHHGGSLRFWNHQNMAILNSFEVTEEPVHAAKFIAREKWVVAGDGNGCILVYSYDKHQEVMSFDAHRTSITCLAVHPTQPFLLSSSHGDHQIKLWDWEKDWECTRTFQGYGVVKMTFNLDNTNDFASASSDGVVKIWSIDSDDGKIITLYGLCVGYFMRRNRQHLITGVKDGNAAQIWNLEEDGCVQKLEGHTGHITIVHLHPELPLLIIGSLDGTVSLWNSTTYKIENIIDFNLGAVCAFGYIKGLRRMVVGCQQGIAMVEIPSS
ncbi:unnamed protein product [Alopecurus aequalis]